MKWDSYRARVVVVAALAGVWLPATAAGGQDTDGAGDIEVTAEPSTGLVDFQFVQVTGVGFEPFSIHEIFECRADAVDESGCDPDNAFFADADADGVVAFNFPVDARIHDMTGEEFDCRSAPNACKVGIGLLDDFSASGFALLDFDPTAPLRPLPTVVVEPDTGLRDGQQVRVVGADLLPGFQTTALQCVADRPSSGTTCDFNQAVRGGAAADGTIELSFRVDATLRASVGGETFDCTAAPGACVIELQVGPSPDRQARAPLSFAEPEPEPEPRPPSTPTAGPPSAGPPSPGVAPPATPVVATPTFTG
jgi:hypothetical protein